MFAASATSSPFSALFYLKHYIVAKGALGYLVEGINRIFEFKIFSTVHWILLPSLPWSPV